MKDKELKLDEIRAFHTKGGSGTRTHKAFWGVLIDLFLGLDHQSL
jgi:hypothetical protein